MTSFTEKRFNDSIVDRALFFSFWMLCGLWKCLRPNSKARAYSNQLLRRYLKELGGDILNVSGWEDSDREDRHYRNYYGTVNSYTVSNIEGNRGMPKNRAADAAWIQLDIELPLPRELNQRFDVVFCHTVLEHVFETRIALSNLDKLSRDVVIIVVPFSQCVHYSEPYFDYVRFTPYYLDKFFRKCGFTTLLCDANEQPFTTSYVTYIAARNPERHPEFAGAVRRFDISISLDRFGRRRTGGLDDA